MRQLSNTFFVNLSVSPKFRLYLLNTAGSMWLKPNIGSSRSVKGLNLLKLEKEVKYYAELDCLLSSSFLFAIVITLSNSWLAVLGI